MNKITISGKIKDKPQYSHEFNGENFYTFDISTSRLSGFEDVIPCLISEYYLPIEDEITVVGEIRTKNFDGSDGKRHLSVYVFVRNVLPYNEVDTNEVELEGFICKPPIYRETPHGKQITDLVIASNRTHGKSDYIPTITWGGLARKSANLQLGDCVTIKGRLQSREYVKQYGDGTCEDRVAYELSASRVEESEVK